MLSDIKSRKGFTLFELMITIAIIGMVVGVVMGGMNDILQLNMKKASSRLASTIRYLYNKSATEGCYIRLILDLKERNYWVEATKDPVLVEKVGTNDDESDKKSDTDEDKNKLKPSKPSFGHEDSFLLKPTKLPDNVFFKDVFVEHMEAPVDSGQVAIYFFPNGYVEHCIINLRNESDDVFFSLESSPISGEVAIDDHYHSFEE